MRVTRLARMAEPILEQLPDTHALLFAGYRDARFKQWNAQLSEAVPSH